MKKLLVLILLLTIPLHLCSCSVSDENRINLDKSHDEYQDASNNYETSIEEKPKYEYGSDAEVLSREIKDFSDVKVKEHSYKGLALYEHLPDILKYQSRYYYLYANFQAEELFNMINAKDRNGIISKMSPYLSEAKKDMIEKEIDVLFKYFDEAIIDYEEDPDPSDYSVAFEYGTCTECRVSATFYAITDNNRYSVLIYFYLVDEEENRVGINYIAVATEDVNKFWDDYYIDHTYDPSKDDHDYDDGIICMTKGGFIKVNM